MSKRLRVSSRFQLRKHGSSVDSSEDRISSLPEGILVDILSRLTLRESVRTSIISHTWKNLWTFTTMNMDFEAPSVMFKLNADCCDNRMELLDTERNKFMKWVDQVLQSHKGEVGDSFKVCFGLDSTHKSNLDRWIEFAIQKKRVTILEISLWYFYGSEKVSYRFPEEVSGYSNLKLLRVLRMSLVELSGPLLEDIVAKCPSLEELSVSWAKTLQGVKLSGLNLKLIEIRQCFEVEHLEVDAPSLTSLVYTGGKPSIRLTNVSKLHALELGGRYCDRGFPMFPEVSSFFSQIDTLTLSYDHKIWELPRAFPEYKILKYLNLTLYTKDDQSLLNSISLVKACPMLHTLVFNFLWMSEYEERRLRGRKGEEFECLKVVEFKCFYGYSADYELAISIIVNAPHLEKITFDPWCPISDEEQNPLGVRGLGLEYDYNPRRYYARKRARKLANKYCPNVQLVVL